MKRLIILFCVFMIYAAASAQSIVQAEYFVNDDPGFGNGTPIPVGPGMDVTLNFNVNTNGLENGMHKLFIRAKDDNGAWTSVAHRPFLLGNYPADPLLPLLRAEYFIDEDPGQGLGTPKTFDSNVGQTVKSFVVNLHGVEVGMHMLYIRTHDENGHWSLTYAEPFEVEMSLIVADFSANITEGSLPLSVQFTDETYMSEPHTWFWDFGDGNTSTVQHPQHTYADPGKYTVSLTATSDAGSDTETKLDYITVYPPLYTLEYFFDNDPGYGNGNKVYNYSSLVGGFDFNIPVDELADGFHILYFRAIDTAGYWTHTYSRSFLKAKLINEPCPNIVATEYFFDDDPGYGFGFQFPVTPGTTDEIEVVIPLVDVAHGWHELYLRTKDENGQWSLTSSRSFLKLFIPDDPVTITHLEYFIDDDPGAGNGIPVEITPGNMVEQSFIIYPGALPSGEYTLYVRARDDRDSWSIVFNQMFEVEPSTGGPPNWEPNPYLQYNMQIIGKLQYDDETFSLNGNDIIGAFVGEDCRGVMSPNPNFMGILFLTVGSNLQAGETVTFKAYLAEEDRVVELNESLLFENQLQVGSIPDPFIFSYGEMFSHLINLPSGWSGLSSYIIPAQPAMEAVFAPIADHLIIAQTMTQIYYPGENINQIGNWDNHSAYKVKTTVACTLPITGEYETDMTVSLGSGWSMLPVVTPDGANAADLFTSVNGFVIAKDVAGTGVYWPQYNINSMGYILPGKAYYVLMTAPGVVDYTGMKSSGNLTGLDETLTGFGTLSGLGYNITPTPFTHTIAILPSALKDLEVGTIIGAFDQGGNCFGVTIISENANHLTIFGDDPITAEKDGFFEGEMIFCKNLSGLDPAIAGLTGLEPLFDQNLPQSSGLFTDNGLSAITGFKSSTGVGFTDFGRFVNIFPNPSDGVVNITGLQSGAKITLTDVQGQVVLDIETLTAGQISVDLTDYNAGVYFIKIEINGQHIFRKLVLR